MAAQPLAQSLIDEMFTSETLIAVDSVLSMSIFGQQTRKKTHRTHNMQLLAVQLNIQQEERQAINARFRSSGLEKYSFDDPGGYKATADRLAAEMYQAFSSLSALGPEAVPVISWFLAAYSMVINEAGSVKLSTLPMGRGKELGFSIQAKKDFKKNEIIYELLGLMPMDNETPHSRLSEVRVHSSQNQPSGSVRVLSGPIRFVNHLCKEFNAAFMSVTETSALYAYATRKIRYGEEITLDYGDDYFEDVGCPCRVCVNWEANDSDVTKEYDREADTSKMKNGNKREADVAVNKEHKRVENIGHVTEGQRRKRRRRDMNARLDKAELLPPRVVKHD
ncbi:hypothetical protein BDZ97DRAFT_1918635 [Flammula alnicola]|nr:hypothetical protein BDZ97DRAFT_1918635 [Flammula alnicola]